MKMCGQALAVATGSHVAGLAEDDSLIASYNTVLLLSSLEWVTVYISGRFEELQSSGITMQLTDRQRNIC